MTLHYALLDDIAGQARHGLRLVGPDTRRFLQGTLTANVEALGSGQAAASGLCTVKGKLICELVLLPESDTAMQMLVPADQAEAVAEIFDRHIIMDEVEVERSGPVGVAVVWSEAADEPPEVTLREGITGYTTRHPAPGRLLVGEPDVLRGCLAEHTAVDASGWAARRIATASPAWGHELRPDRFPPEVGFVYAVSYNKGCFLGQEPLARIHARGQVNRVMVRVRAASSPPGATAGAMDLASDERPGVGQWTTWAPVGEQVEGLAIVRRAAAAAGTSLRTTSEPAIAVEVISGPLGDDPGVGGGGNRSATVSLGGRR